MPASLIPIHFFFSMATTAINSDFFFFFFVKAYVIKPFYQRRQFALSLYYDN